VMIRCPGCGESIEVEPDEEGQVSCPECWSYFPLGWAEALTSFEAERETRNKGPE
jgi:hypothetical protein